MTQTFLKKIIIIRAEVGIRTAKSVSVKKQMGRKRRAMVADALEVIAGKASMTIHAMRSICADCKGRSLRFPEPSLASWEPSLER